jgi:hypothetical protein
VATVARRGFGDLLQRIYAAVAHRDLVAREVFDRFREQVDGLPLLSRSPAVNDAAASRPTMSAGKTSTQATARRTRAARANAETATARMRPLRLPSDSVMPSPSIATADGECTRRRGPAHHPG